MTEKSVDENGGNETIQRLVAKIKALETELSKATSEKGEKEAELKKLQDELEEAETWLM